MILALINQYTKKLYHYITISLTKFVCNKIQISFYCFVITTTLKSIPRDTLVERWGADNMPLPSCDSIFM